MQIDRIEKQWLILLETFGDNSEIFALDDRSGAISRGQSMTARVEAFLLRPEDRIFTALAPKEGMTVRQFVVEQPPEIVSNMVGDVLLFQCNVRRFITTYLEMKYSQGMARMAGRIILKNLGDPEINVSSFLIRKREFEGINRKLQILSQVPDIITNDKETVYLAWTRIFLEEIFHMEGSIEKFAMTMQEVFDAFSR